MQLLAKVGDWPPTLGRVVWRQAETVLRPYRDCQVFTETGQRLLTETTTEPGRKTETVECVREGFASLTLLTHSTVSVFRTGFVMVSVFGLCPVSV